MYWAFRSLQSPKVHYISGARRDTAYGVLVLPLQGAKTALYSYKAVLVVVLHNKFLNNKFITIFVV